MTQEKFAAFLDTLSELSTQQDQDKDHAISQWVDRQPPSEQAEAKQWLRLWQRIQTPPEYLPSTEQRHQAWQQIHDRIHASLSPVLQAKPKLHLLPNKRLLRWGLAIAASLLFVCMAYVVQGLIHQQNPQLMRLHHQDRSPRALRLPDGTEVWLKQGATLEYPASFSADTRNVQLLQGQAYFDVYSNPSQPFIVSTPHFRIHVTGTAFDIRAEEDQSILSVEEGRVRVESPSLRFASLRLEAKQQLIITPHARYTRTLNSENHLAWRTGLLSFQDTSLGKILEALSDYYKVSLQAPPLSTKCAITVTFNKQSLESALDLIDQLTEGSHKTLEKDSYLVQPSKCL